MTPSQRAIYNFVRSKGTATKEEIFSFTGDPYYRNGEKYIGERLSRMVNAGMLKRVKPGVFAIGSGKRAAVKPVNENQIMLFE